MFFISIYVMENFIGDSQFSFPIVVVLSGSMEPAFQRGDILFLWNRDHQQKVGDIVVYEIDGKSIPIVHRVLREHHNLEKQLLLTKGIIMLLMIYHYMLKATIFKSKTRFGGYRERIFTIYWICDHFN